jgi:ketosteroid isomerase-like protein
MSSAETEAILGHHMQPFTAKDLDALLSDYTEDSVVITAEKTYKGKAEIGTFFLVMLAGVTPEFLAAFNMVKQEIVGDIAYINFTGERFLTLGSDTLVMKDGTKAVQAFTAQPAR